MSVSSQFASSDCVTLPSLLGRSDRLVVERPHPPSEPIHTCERGSAWGRMGTTFNGADRPSNEFASKWGRLFTDNVLNVSSLYLIYATISLCLSGVFSLNIFPLPPCSPYLTLFILLIGLYNILNISCGWITHRTSFPFENIVSNLHTIDRRRMGMFRNVDNNVARVSIRVNGSLVDVVLVGKKEYTGNGRYVIFSNSNIFGAQSYEDRASEQYLALARELQATALFFNYPATGRSEGWFPNREAICASHVAVHDLLQDESLNPTPEGREKVIFDIGYAIGGTVQGVAMPAMRGGAARRIFVKINAFSSYSEYVQAPILPWVIQGMIRLLNWDYAPLCRSENLEDREVVIHTGDDLLNWREGEEVRQMESVNELATDNYVVPAWASYAYASFRSREAHNNNRGFFLIRENQYYHTWSDNAIHQLARIIDPALSVGSTGGNESDPQHP